MKQLTAAGILLFVSGAAVAGLFGPSNYDECILENMKGIADRAAAGAIMQACARKFPEPKAALAPPAPVAQPAAASSQPVRASSRITDFVPDK